MKNTNRNDTANPVALPPLIYGGFVIAGFAVDYAFPISAIPDHVQYPLGVVLLLVSFAIMPFVLIRFRQAGTSFDAGKPTSSIITDGPYRYSRNPSYVSLTLLYVGIGVVADNAWLLALAPVVVAVMHYGVIRREEEYLERKFGQNYLAYKATVRRWL